MCYCVCVISLYKRASVCVDSLSGGEENLEETGGAGEAAGTGTD